MHSSAETKVWGTCEDLNVKLQAVITKVSILNCPPSEITDVLCSLKEISGVVANLEMCCQQLVAQSQHSAEFAARASAAIAASRHVIIDPTAANSLDLILNAAEVDNVRLLAAFLDGGADVNSVDDDQGDTILNIAIKRNAVENVMELLSRGADLNIRNKDQMSALDVAVTQSAKMVSLLLEGGASVDACALDGTTALFRAVRVGAAEAAILLLDKKADPNAADELGWTPLWCAAMQTKSLEMISLLCANKSTVHSINRDGVGLIHAVVAAGLGSVFDRLIDLGADPNMRTHACLSPLRTAVAHENVEMAARVIWRGARVNDKDREGRTALHHTTLSGTNIKVMNTLIENGANVNAVDKEGMTPLHLACMINRVDAADILLNNGAEMNIANKEGKFALHTAVMCSSVETIKRLHQSGVDLNASFAQSPCPLLAAIEGKCYSSADELMALGADIHIRNQIGATTLHAAIAVKHAPTVRTLIYRGADINAIDTEGRTAIRMCVEHTAVDIAEILAASNADLDIPDQHGYTPLIYACMEKSRVMVRLLCKFGAAINLTDKDGWSALFHSVERDDQKTVSILIANGATIDGIDSAGRTPLRIAIAGGNAAMAGLLVEGGAEINAVDQENRTALFWAVAHDSMSGVELALGGAPNVHICDGETPIDSHQHHSHSTHCNNSNNTLLSITNGVENRLTLTDGSNKLLASSEKVGNPAVVSEKEEAERKVEHEMTTSDNNKILQTNLDSIGVLVALGADVDQLNDWGQTALHFAVQSGNEPTVQSLVNHGASLSHRDVYDRNALSIAVSKKNAEMVELLVSLNAPLDATNKYGRTILFDAVETGDISVLRLLVSKSESLLKSRDNDGNSIIHWCVCKGSDRILGALLELGADPNIQNNVGETPLMTAIAADNMIAIRRLLKSLNVDLTLRDQQNRNVLWHALFAKRAEICDLLIDNGADVSSQSPEGSLPMEWAIASTCAPIVRMLLARGVNPDPKVVEAMTGQMAKHLGITK